MKTSKELIDLLLNEIYALGEIQPENFYYIPISHKDALDIIEHLKVKAFSEHKSTASPPEVKVFSEEAFIDLHFKIQNALIDYRKEAKGQT